MNISYKQDIELKNIIGEKRILLDSFSKPKLLN